MKFLTFTFAMTVLKPMPSSIRRNGAVGFSDPESFESRGKRYGRNSDRSFYEGTVSTDRVVSNTRSRHL